MLDDYLTEIGFNKSDISYIKSIYFQSSYDETSLLYNFRNIVNYFHKNGLSNVDIINIIKFIPELVITSLENIKIRVRDLNNIGFNRLQVFKIIKEYPYIIKLSTQKIYNKVKFLTSLGFSSSNVIDIISNNINIISLDNSIISNKFNYFGELGYSPKEVINLLYLNPNIIDTNLNNIKSKYKYLTDLGFKDKDIIKISLCIPDIYTSDNDILKINFSYLLDYGFTMKNIISIINKIPNILDKQYLDLLTEKFDNLTKLGFSKNEIVNNIKNNPYILLFTCECINNNHDILIKEGFNNYTISLCPLLITYNSFEIENRISFYKKINIYDMILDNPSFLLFNLDFIKLRYNYLQKKNQSLHCLFLDDIMFYNKYHITRDKLLKGDK